MGHVSAVTNQTDFRGREDSGNEATPTWIATANTNWSQDVDVDFRCRFVFAETAGADVTITPDLEFNLNGGGWTTVGAATAIQWGTFTGATDGDATTQLVGSGTFVAGELDSNGAYTDITLNNSESEMEYCLTIDSAQVADTDTFQLRVTDKGVALDTYTNTPTITVVEAAGVTATWDQDRQQGFATDADWATASSLAALNIGFTVGLDTSFVIWIGIEETAGSTSSETPTFKAQYRRKPSGGSYGVWTDVGLSGTTLAVKSAVDAQLTNRATLAQRITSGTYRDGFGVDKDSIAPWSTDVLAATQGNDWYEFAFSTDFDTAGTDHTPGAGDEYQFRASIDPAGGSTWQDLDTFTNTITVTIEGGGVTADLDVTLDDVTLSASASSTLAADLTATLGAATLSSTTSIDLTVTASIELDPLTVSSTAAIDVLATLVETLDAMTLGSTGTVGNVSTGALSATLDDAILSAVGSSDLAASFAYTLGDLTLSGDLSVDIAGFFASNLDELTLNTTGSVGISATLSATMDDLTFGADGTALAGASVDVSLEDLTVSGSASTELAASLAVILDELSLVGAGSLDVAATLSEMLDDVSLSSTSSISVIASLSNTLEELGLSATGTILSGPVATLSVTLDELLLSSAVSAEISTAVVISLDDAALTSSGSVAVSAGIVETLDDLALSSSVAVASGPTADANITLGDLTLSSDVSSNITADAALVLDDATVLAAGSVGVAADAAITLGDLELSALGTASAKGVTCSLVARNGDSIPDLVSLSWAWFDAVDPILMVAPSDQGDSETTDTNGLLLIEIPNSTLLAGQSGTLVLRSDDGTLFGAYSLEVA